MIPQDGLASALALVETLVIMLHLLDLAPKGRDEEGLPYGMAWLRHHDRYDGEIVRVPAGLKPPSTARTNGPRRRRRCFAWGCWPTRCTALARR